MTLTFLKSITQFCRFYNLGMSIVFSRLDHFFFFVLLHLCDFLQEREKQLLTAQKELAWLALPICLTLVFLRVGLVFTARLCCFLVEHKQFHRTGTLDKATLCPWIKTKQGCSIILPKNKQKQEHCWSLKHDQAYLPPGHHECLKLPYKSQP